MVNYIFTFKILTIIMKNIKAPMVNKVTPPEKSFSLARRILSGE